MTDSLKNAKLFARKKDEHFCLYEYYARANGLQSKSMLILMWIYYNPKGITQNTICQKTYSTKQVVNATIKTFLQKGWIYFAENEDDKRSKKIKLTSEGYTFASKLLDTLEAAEEEAMQRLKPEEQAQFLEWLSVLNIGLKKNIEKLIKEERG